MNYEVPNQCALHYSTQTSSDGDGTKISFGGKSFGIGNICWLVSTAVQ